ncbi:MAG: hypothetical protein JSS66_15975 [Armatimonadetes bacterium]|nr:hypothetical protein [Armatimonadota bacterium]
MSKGMRDFAILAGCLFVIRLFLGFLSFPAGIAPVLNFLSTIVFLGLPIIALYRAADEDWTAKAAGLCLGAGAAVHVLGGLALRFVLPPFGLGTLVVQSLVQLGIAFWTLGLGAYVALLIKDKNLILPVALFLAGLDVFLVFYPAAPTSKIVRQYPVVFQSMGVTVPSARPATPREPQGARVVPQAYVGPADLLFIAAFLIALHRFGMKVRETVKWLVPVMVVYLLLVLSPLNLNTLPALVPIGLTVLAVNWREFHLSREERAMVWGAGLLAFAIAVFGLVAHFKDAKARLAEPLTTETAPGGSGSATRPPQPAGGQPQ